MGWLEERRFDWVPVTMAALSHLMGGTPFIIITDNERQWFAKYLVTMLNCAERNRPHLPIFNAFDITPGLEQASRADNIDLIDNMLSLAFNDRYILWYIGRSDNVLAKLPKKLSDSFLWVIDEDIQNSFAMRSRDQLLDIKLMHMARLLDKTIDAAMFGKVTI